MPAPPIPNRPFLVGTSSSANDPIADVASRGPDYFDLQWLTVANATAYDVKLVSSEGERIVQNATSGTRISALTSDLSYSVQVRAKDGPDASDWSSRRQIFTRPRTPPRPFLVGTAEGDNDPRPGNLTNNQPTSRTPDSLSLTWGSVSGISQFEIQINGGAASTATRGQNHNGLTSNSQHDVRVRSVSTGGRSFWSSTRTVFTRPDTPKSPFLVNTAPGNSDPIPDVHSRGPNFLILNWDDPGIADAYFIQVDSQSPVQRATTDHRFNGLDTNTSYALRVRFRDDNAGGISFWSSRRNCTTRPPTVPQFVRDDFDPVPRGVAFSWSATGSFNNDASATLNILRDSSDGREAVYSVNQPEATAGGNHLDLFLPESGKVSYFARLAVGANSSFPSNRFTIDASEVTSWGYDLIFPTVRTEPTIPPPTSLSGSTLLMAGMSFFADDGGSGGGAKGGGGGGAEGGGGAKGGGGGGAEGGGGAGGGGGGAEGGSGGRGPRDRDHDVGGRESGGGKSDADRAKERAAAAERARAERERSDASGKREGTERDTGTTSASSQSDGVNTNVGGSQVEGGSQGQSQSNSESTGTTAETKSHETTASTGGLSSTGLAGTPETNRVDTPNGTVEQTTGVYRDGSAKTRVEFPGGSVAGTAAPGENLSTNISTDREAGLTTVSVETSRENVDGTVSSTKTSVTFDGNGNRYAKTEVVEHGDVTHVSERVVGANGNYAESNTTMAPSRNTRITGERESEFRGGQRSTTGGVEVRLDLSSDNAASNPERGKTASTPEKTGKASAPEKNTPINSTTSSGASGSTTSQEARGYAKPENGGANRDERGCGPNCVVITGHRRKRKIDYGERGPYHDTADQQPIEQMPEEPGLESDFVTDLLFDTVLTLGVGALLGIAKSAATGIAGAVTRRGATTTLTTAQPTANQVVMNYLGEGAYVPKQYHQAAKAGRSLTSEKAVSDLVIVSKDGTRRVRFDLSRPAPHGNPHMHAERKVGNTWESTTVYPNGVNNVDSYIPK